MPFSLFSGYDSADVIASVIALLWLISLISARFLLAFLWVSAFVIPRDIDLMMESYGTHCISA
jgi:hypothetical protein